MTDRGTEVRVLLVEDSPLFRETIGRILDQVGYTVVGEATDGRQGITLAQTLQPDVILMDIEMPGMDGLEAARHIQSSCPTPVVMLTVHDTPDLAQQAGAVGAGAYLVKPPDVEELRRAIAISRARFRDMMALRRLNKELEARQQTLQEALASIRTLSGLLPICPSCKKVRDDEGYWQQVETYLANHADVEFSHGICPECARKLYPDFYQD